MCTQSVQRLNLVTFCFYPVINMYSIICLFTVLNLRSQSPEFSSRGCGHGQHELSYLSARLTHVNNSKPMLPALLPEFRDQPQG